MSSRRGAGQGEKGEGKEEEVGKCLVSVATPLQRDGWRVPLKEQLMTK